jgi:hypothetical protein
MWSVKAIFHHPPSGWPMRHSAVRTLQKYDLDTNGYFIWIIITNFLIKLPPQHFA